MLTSTRRLGATLLALGLAAGALAGCGGPSGASAGKLDVIVSFYPLQYVAERVGGDRVNVTNMVKPGAEPHDLELQPKQVAALGEADLVLYLSGFQPQVDEAVKERAEKTSFDAATVAPLREAPPGAGEDGPDPHFWLDPTRLAAVAERVAERLVALDADHAADFRAGAAALRADLDRLDSEYAKGLANCQRREIVTSHAAFGYLAARYNLTQIPITGVEPEAEPTPQRLAEVVELARKHGATTIFSETLVSPKVAEALAREVNAKTEVLDPIEGVDDGDYLSVMRSNLTKLRPALGCQ